MSNTRIQQYLTGIRSGLPVIPSFLPVGIAYAIIAQQAGFTPFETVLMSATVLAGSSQIMAAGMVLQGAGLAAVIFATFVLNLRHLIMSTCGTRRCACACWPPSAWRTSPSPSSAWRGRRTAPSGTSWG